MANKKDGITDLTKLLITASKKFTKTEYSTLTSVVFAMLHGVNYGYTEMDQRFLNDALDIYEVHQDDKEFFAQVDKNLDEVERTLSKFKKHLPKKQNKKNKNNVIKFSDYVGATHDGR